MSRFRVGDVCKPPGVGGAWLILEFKRTPGDDGDPYAYANCMDLHSPDAREVELWVRSAETCDENFCPLALAVRRANLKEQTK